MRRKDERALRRLFKGRGRPGPLLRVLNRLAPSADETLRRVAEQEQSAQAASLLMPLLIEHLKREARDDDTEVLVALGGLVRCGAEPEDGLWELLAQLIETGPNYVNALAVVVDALSHSNISLQPIRGALEQSPHLEQRCASALRWDDVRNTHGALVVGCLLEARERATRSNVFREAFELVALLLLDADARARARALSVLPALEDASGEVALFVALAPVMRHALFHSDGAVRLMAIRSIRQAVHCKSSRKARKTLPRPIVEVLGSMVEPLGRLLARPDNEISRVRLLTSMLCELSEKGLVLSAIHEVLGRVLEHSESDVRAAASRALSASLQASGAESRLPRGASHRRTYARSDDGEAGGRLCRVCEGRETRLIYHFSEGGNTWWSETREYLCEACGVYSTFVEGY